MIFITAAVKRTLKIHKLKAFKVPTNEKLIILTLELRYKVTCYANPSRKVCHLAWNAHTLHDVLCLRGNDVPKTLPSLPKFP